MALIESTPAAAPSDAGSRPANPTPSAHATATAAAIAPAATATAADPAGLAALRQVLLAGPFEAGTPGAQALDGLRRSHPGLVFETLPETGGEDRLARAELLVIARFDRPIDDWLALAPRLRWIHVVSAGVDRWLSPKLQERGVLLTNSRGVHAVPIAEHVLALLLAFARGLPALIDAQRAARWTPHPFKGSFELQGQTLAIVGQGAIGSALAQRASALGLRLRGVRRQARAEEAPAVVGLDQLDTVLAEADHVAICLPLTPQTQGLFDAPRLARLKRGAYLYNIGRGAIVDQPALIDALTEGRIAGAGLDVVEPEPLPPESPLWRLPQVLITSHTSGASPHNLGRSLAILDANLQAAARGEPLRNVVDPARGY